MLASPSPSKLEPGAGPKSLKGRGQPSQPRRGLHLETQLGCSGPQRSLWRGLGSKESINWQLFCAVLRLLPSLFYHHHPPPHNHKTTFPRCFSKTEVEETVVVANEYFSETFCPEPSALENSNGDQMESFSLMYFTFLIKEKTTDLLNSLSKNLWNHFGHYSFIFLFFVQNFQPGRQKTDNF